MTFLFLVPVNLEPLYCISCELLEVVLYEHKVFVNACSNLVFVVKYWLLYIEALFSEGLFLFLDGLWRGRGGKENCSHIVHFVGLNLYYLLQDTSIFIWLNIYVEYVLGRVTLLAEGCRGSLSEVCLTYLVILSQFQFFIFWIM